MRMPSSDTSRPQPDSLKPPKGMAGSITPWQFIHTIPALSRAAAQLEIIGPDVGSQPVAGVVGLPDHVIHVVEAGRRNHGAEDFLTHDLHVGPGVAEDRRLHIIALVARGGAAGDQIGTLGLAAFDERHDPFLLLLRDQRAEHGVGVAPVGKLSATAAMPAMNRS